MAPVVITYGTRRIIEAPECRPRYIPHFEWRTLGYLGTRFLTFASTARRQKNLIRPGDFTAESTTPHLASSATML